MEAYIMSKVMGYKTEWLSRESLIHIVEMYDLPSQVLIRPAGVEERACSAPRDHWMLMFYTTSHKCNKGSDRDEEEEIEKLMKEGDDVVDIMYLTSLDVVEVAELYEESSLSEVEIDKFLSTVGGLAIPKKPQKKSKIYAATATRLVQKRMRLKEHKGRGDEMVEFVPHPSPIELDLELREEFFETLKERGTLAKENEDLGKKKEEVEKDLAEAMLELMQLQEENDSLKMKLAIEEKRKICEEKIEAQEKEIKKMKEVGAELKKNVDLLVHSSMKDHIVEFLKSNTFNNIVNLYHLPMAILAFIDCRKKVKAQMADFCPKVKLKWDHDNEGRIIFPSNFDFEFVAIEEGAEVGVAEVGENVSEEEGNQEEVNQPTPPIE
ncbi:hypothetical protein SLEP1_g11643 [Rubroshorea leprosula]|nr:hypothetical protein SLEP1_g11643 [Rubroshorea leprosula]